MTACTMRQALCAALLAVLALSFAAPASAHKVNIFAYAEGGQVHTESYFADGGRAAGCRVTVEDMSGSQLLEGVTDKEGRFTFDIPRAMDLRIVLHASMGHKNDFVIKAPELEAAMQGGGKAEIPAPAGMTSVEYNPPVRKSSAVDDVKKTASSEEASALPPSMTAEELRAVVDETVEARLKPVYGMLADIRESSGRPRLSDVIGGIGYIMGIMGIILYFRSRKT